MLLARRRSECASQRVVERSAAHARLTLLLLSKRSIYTISTATGSSVTHAPLQSFMLHAQVLPVASDQRAVAPSYRLRHPAHIKLRGASPEHERCGRVISQSLITGARGCLRWPHSSSSGWEGRLSKPISLSSPSPASVPPPGQLPTPSSILCPAVAAMCYLCAPSRHGCRWRVADRAHSDTNTRYLR